MKSKQVLDVQQMQKLGMGLKKKTMMYWAKCCYGVLRTNI